MGQPQLKTKNTLRAQISAKFNDWEKNNTKAQFERLCRHIYGCVVLVTTYCQ